MSGMAWTKQRIKLLKALWAEGTPAAAIAAQLGISSAAVLGKVFRLRLKPKRARGDAGSPKRRKRGWRYAAKPAAPVVPVAPAKAPDKTAPDKTAPDKTAPDKTAPDKTAPDKTAPDKTARGKTSRGKTLFELKNDNCRWPIGRPGAPGFHFCGEAGADLDNGRPYCERHANRAYVRPKKARNTRAPGSSGVAAVSAPPLVPGEQWQRVILDVLRRRV